MSKYTPGPWRSEALHGRSVITADMWNIAEVFRFVGGNSPHEDDADANARLIAAAPDLLAACELVMSRNTPMHGYATDPLDSAARSHDDMRIIRAAIAKARGEDGDEG